ncbi:hypothetical protein Tco_0535982 [Tanacetum coccineum]
MNAPLCVADQRTKTNTPFVVVTRETNAPSVPLLNPTHPWWWSVVGGGCNDDDGGMGRGNGVERVVTRWWRWCRVAWQRRGGGDSGVVARGGASGGERIMVLTVVSRMNQLPLAQVCTIRLVLRQFRGIARIGQPQELIPQE